MERRSPLRADRRHGLSDGTPAPLLEHQDTVGEIFRQLANALAGTRCRVFVSPVDVRLPQAGQSDDAVRTVVQTEVLVVCDPSKLDRRGVRGAPDLVIEVLSAATASHDQVVKRRVYERAGVREYWLVHPVDRVVTIYRPIDGQYGRPDVFEPAGTTPVGVLAGVAIAWDELAQRLPKPEA